jgi:hypothetical protein
VIGGLAALWVTRSPALPVSAKMSDAFKKQAFPAVVGTGCALNGAKPQNSADQRVADLFEECFQYDNKMIDLRSNPDMTDSMKEEYDSLADKRRAVRGELELIFKEEGMDVDAERAKDLKRLLPK